jgi:hypothetical protein
MLESFLVYILGLNIVKAITFVLMFFYILSTVKWMAK